MDSTSKEETSSKKSYSHKKKKGGSRGGNRPPYEKAVKEAKSVEKPAASLKNDGPPPKAGESLTKQDQSKKAEESSKPDKNVDRQKTV
jgi:hypothetical protein